MLVKCGEISIHIRFCESTRRIDSRGDIGFSGELVSRFIVLSVSHIVVTRA